MKSKALEANEPLVCAILLTRDRPEMAARAVAAFRAQIYGRFSVLVYDTSEKMPDKYPEFGSSAVLYHYRGPTNATIGALRNEAIEFAMIAKSPKQFDVFVHADDDDLSHPNRIAEQVAHLTTPGHPLLVDTETGVLLNQTGGALDTNPVDIVGYHSMLFVDQRTGGKVWKYVGYPGYAIGTSLMYWRKTWEARPFPDQNIGEDTEFCKNRRVVSVDAGEMMVARMHKGMTTVRNMERFEAGGEGHVYQRVTGELENRARKVFE